MICLSHAWALASDEWGGFNSASSSPGAIARGLRYLHPRSDYWHVLGNDVVSQKSSCWTWSRGRLQSYHLHDYVIHLSIVKRLNSLFLNTIRLTAGQSVIILILKFMVFTPVVILFLHLWDLQGRYSYFHCIEEEGGVDRPKWFPPAVRHFADKNLHCLYRLCICLLVLL